ncbi:MAG: hypothetical protein D6803_08905, partial [Anaerolineae bacterium]
MSAMANSTDARRLSRRSRVAYLQKRIAQAVLSLYGWGGYAFMYLPIVILVVFSFNDSRSTAQWVGFSTRWYVEMANDR